MLSNQGQAVNLRDGSPRYLSNFTQRDILRVYRLPCRRSVPPLQIHPIHTSEKPNNYKYVLCDVTLHFEGGRSRSALPGGCGPQTSGARQRDQRLLFLP